MYTYEEAQANLICYLSQAADSHCSGKFSVIGEAFDKFDQRLPRTHDPRFKKLLIALNFWDGWCDARNHEWQYYSGIQKDDWPQLARLVVADLESDREITNEVLLHHFGIQPKQGVFRRFISSRFFKC
jgi:hypothetical protein